MDTEQDLSAEGAADSQGGNAWKWDRQRLALIIAASVALIALIALAAAIDLPESDDEQEQAEGQDSDAQGSEGGNLGEGFPGGGRVDLGDGSSLEVKPIPGCPDGFAIGDNILIIPDPEACGYRRLAPGETSDPSGPIILTPSIDGDIGGFRVGPNGEIELLAPGELGRGDIGIGMFPDGSFGLVQPDGSRIEITPGDDGIELRDPVGGDTFIIPRGDGEPGGSPFDDEPRAQDGQSANPPQQNGDDEDSGGSSLGQTLLWVLLPVVALGLIALIVSAMRGGDDTKSDDDDDLDDADLGGDEAHESVADYSAELNALDRMLWEIDQEPDPRTAIRRVYAALETGLDNPDMARRRSETPGIYLRRILGRFDALNAPLSELTDLFQQARFSEHEITPAMRDRAVHALVTVRGHYAHAATQPLPAQPAF